MRAIVSILLSAVTLLLACGVSFADRQLPDNSGVETELAPECWNFQEHISFTGELRADQPEVETRISTYEIYDDDSVNPNHLLQGLPYYSSLTWTGSSDVEWLTLEGDFSHYTLDPAAHSVTFYNLRNWLHVVYRTRNFVQRSPDRIRFCVIGQNGSVSRSTQVRVRYPANYQVQQVTPPGFSIPAPGEVVWNFGSIQEFQVDTTFAGLGPDRPLLDLPVDYEGRDTGSSLAFSRAFNTRITSLFDHRYPNYSRDSRFLPYNGIEVPDPPNVICEFGSTCYDGHDAYDIDDRCPTQAPCSDPSAVFPAADGTINQSGTGWDDQLGCRITIDHGNGWTTVYAHLQDQNNNYSCSGILVWSGEVTRTRQIGRIGGTGSGGGGSQHAHLHFAVRRNGRVVDPSGWEPGAAQTDPWANHPNGTASYNMWMYAIRTTQALDPSIGGQLTSPTHRVHVSVPSGFHSVPLYFNLSNQSVASTPGLLINTGHSFSLTALDGSGNRINRLQQMALVEVRFGQADVQGIDPSSLSLYRWDASLQQWRSTPTDIDWNTLTANAQIDEMAMYALLGQNQHRAFLPMVVANQSGCSTENGVVLYELPYYQGRCLIVTGNEPDFNWYDFNDVASSIKFFGSYSSGWMVQVFEHTYYMGASSYFWGNEPDFAAHQIGRGRASSILVSRVE